MNAPKRLKMRLPLQAADDFDITTVIPVFHRWIQEQTVPGVLIDVADYKHVIDGPGILLIGDEGDYSLDQAEGQLSLAYDRKRQTGDDLSTAIRIVMEHLEQARRALETDLGVAPNGEPAVLTILDRLQFANSADTFDAIKDEIEAGFEAHDGSTGVRFDQVNSDARRPLTVQVEYEPKLVPA